MIKATVGALVALLTVGAADFASAQDAAEQETGAVNVSSSGGSAFSSRGGAPGPLRIHGGLHLGLGGGWRLEPEDGPGSDTESMAVTPGLQVGADYVVMDYFAIGGEFRLSFFNTKLGQDNDIGRSKFVDINVKPRGRYAFKNIPLEVYGTMPMGLSFAAINDDLGMDGGAGFNLGFGPGATYFFTDRIGVNTEMLGVFHWFGTSVDIPFAGEVEANNRTAQLYFLFNAVFAL